MTPPKIVTAAEKQDSLVPTVTTPSDVSIDRVASPVSHDSLRPKPLNTRDTSNEIPSNPQGDCERSPRDLPEPLKARGKVLLLHHLMSKCDSGAYGVPGPLPKTFIPYMRLLRNRCLRRADRDTIEATCAILAWRMTKEAEAEVGDDVFNGKVDGSTLNWQDCSAEIAERVVIKRVKIL